MISQILTAFNYSSFVGGIRKGAGTLGDGSRSFVQSLK
jgi:hypothetical protein